MQAQCFKRYRIKKKITTYEGKVLPVNFTFTCAFSQFFDTYFQIMNISHLLCVIDILVLSGQRQFELCLCPGRVSPPANHDTRADLADQCLVQLIWIRRTRLQFTNPHLAECNELPLWTKSDCLNDSMSSSFCLICLEFQSSIEKSK